MPNHHNIEPSNFRAGEYVGYDGRGYPWRVIKVRAGEWLAKPGPSHPGLWTAAPIRDTTLTAVARRLSERGAPAAVSAIFQH
jgi:hypothetical protein